MDRGTSRKFARTTAFEYAGRCSALVQRTPGSLDTGASFCGVAQLLFHDHLPGHCGKLKTGIVSFSADAKGKLEKLEGQGFIMTEVVLRPKLLISHARDAERAGRILEKAEKQCLISNSIKAETKLESEINFANE